MTTPKPLTSLILGALLILTLGAADDCGERILSAAEQFEKIRETADGACRCVECVATGAPAELCVESDDEVSAPADLSAVEADAVRQCVAILGTGVTVTSIVYPDGTKYVLSNAEHLCDLAARFKLRENLGDPRISRDGERLILG